MIVPPAGAGARVGEPVSTGNGDLRFDLRIIADMVRPGARLLDVGCGDGALLQHLAQTKAVDGRGIELSMAGVRAAVRRGVSVIQGNADTDLADYPAGAFDYAILSQTLQAMQQPRTVLEQLLRVADHAIVSFPNFGYWKARWHLVTRGRMPVTAGLPEEWWATPNIHFCTIKDFVVLARHMDIRIEHGVALNEDGSVHRLSATGPWANLLSAQAVFLLTRVAPPGAVGA
ncbi:methionine biosynthesis protein MetW [Roseospira marina]|uniref:Methionine biosynthesis protein MetW n=1 Tax=Roseospira marina TaxID=140057 RepID=A0A5M6IFD0_9PROT|nr:methionine biosynthesis protein MetW [Roseospira marina]KAA5606996.1 methionine biosynthesis protein MetW [Roseospira marina]MBB4312822.1 methionine biosynthesis protein MetW [Roseospira marina]MBB5086405.1 methionine biosynthesis protein MetW [Roseospira marina]